MIRTFACSVIFAIGSICLAQTTTIPQPKITTGPKLLPAPTDVNSPLEKLKASRNELQDEREATNKALQADENYDAERRELRKKLDELIKRLDNKPKSTGNEPKTLPKEATTTLPKEAVVPSKEPTTSAVNDALLLAQNLYRTGDFDAALRAFKLIDLTQYTREDRAFIMYMTACCLRRTNKLSEAAAMYREIIDAKDDEFVTECALWQLGSIRWREDLEKQLGQLKQRRESALPK